MTIVILVLLPTIAPLLGGTAEAPTDSLGTLGNIALALGKAALFVVVMIVAGTRLVPRLLTLVSNEGSKELFTLAVLAIAIGFAFLSSTVFGVSFALGAFLAGAVVGESDMSHQAAADALPLRDAFAVLFFVSVGMLLDPATLIEMPLAIAAVVFLVVVSKAIVKFAIIALFGYPMRVALTVAAGLAQIGEFSFIVGTARPVARPPPAGGLPAHRRRGAAVDRAEPAALPLRRSARGAAPHEPADDPPARAAGGRTGAPGADRRTTPRCGCTPSCAATARSAGSSPGRSTGAASPTS